MTQIDTESIVQYLRDNTRMFSDLVCSTLLDMSGVEWTLLGDVGPVSSERKVSTYTAFLHYFGVVTGEYLITLDDKSASVLATLLKMPINEHNGLLFFGGFLKEVLNIAGTRALVHLQTPIGPLTPSTPAFCCGLLDLPKISTVKCAISCGTAVIECSCSINLASYEVVKLLKNSLEKLSTLTESQTAMFVRPDELPEARFQVVYRALQEAGGDIYDVIPLTENRFGYFIGDVAGHGISSGFATASLMALLRQNLLPHTDPKKSLVQINTILCKMLESYSYITAVYAILDRKNMTLEVFNLGHPPVVYLPQDGAVRTLAHLGNTPFGVLDHCEFKSMQIRVKAGDRFILFTDGLLEKKHIWTAFIKDLVRAVETVRLHPLTTLPADLLSSMFTPPEKLTDDVIVMTVEV